MSPQFYIINPSVNIAMFRTDYQSYIHRQSVPVCRQERGFLWQVHLPGLEDVQAPHLISQLKRPLEMEIALRIKLFTMRTMRALCTLERVDARSRFQTVNIYFIL